MSSAQVRKESPTCLRLLLQLMRRAWGLALAKAGSSKAARMAMTAITTNNSIRVKALFCLRVFFIKSFSFNLWFGLRLVVLGRPIEPHRSVANPGVDEFQGANHRRISEDGLPGKQIAARVNHHRLQTRGAQ